ncbi:hypothetical protein IFM89_015253 [Coptis chinensis]|uniref:Uncharacterized protein n=1 Tax=Coptis chinensis TaxID=261450 RepID=A0A835HF02_9MAGN|nr:hypothetical protein IFM89_015253 [Coptis chinensis]
MDTWCLYDDLNTTGVPWGNTLGYLQSMLQGYDKQIALVEDLHLSYFTQGNKIELHRREELDYIHIDQVPSCDSLKFHAHITVTNHGKMSGSHVVMLFSRQFRIFGGAPQKQLIGFNRIDIESSKDTETSTGQTRLVSSLDSSKQLIGFYLE